MGGRRNPRRSAIGVAVSEKDKEFIQQEAEMANMSVSQFLRPGIVLSLVVAYLGLSLEEAVARLIQDEISLEDVVEYLNRGDNVGGLYRIRPPLRDLGRGNREGEG